METAVIIIAILGGVFGAILAIAGKKLAVEEDPARMKSWPCRAPTAAAAAMLAVLPWQMPLSPAKKKAP